VTAPTPKEVFDDLRVCPETQQKCRRASVSYARSNGTGWACMDCEQPMGNEPPVSAVLTAYDAMKAERDEWKRRYFVVADAVAPSSQDAEHLASIVRSTRAERDAAVQERESAMDLAMADERRLMARIDEVRALKARLAACEKIVEAAKRYTDSAPYEVAHYSNDANVAYNVLRAAVATAQGEGCAKCGGSGYAIDTERSGVGRVVGKKCDCGSVAYITNATPTRGTPDE
jgi:hypothetical protein